MYHHKRYLGLQTLSFRSHHLTTSLSHLPLTFWVDLLVIFSRSRLSRREAPPCPPKLTTRSILSPDPSPHSFAPSSAFCSTGCRLQAQLEAQSRPTSPLAFSPTSSYPSPPLTTLVRPARLPSQDAVTPTTPSPRLALGPRPPPLPHPPYVSPTFAWMHSIRPER